MELEDMIIVSVDDHIIEPPNLFDAHIPSKYKARAPQLVYEEGSGQAWTWEGGRSTATFLNCVVTLPSDEWGMDPSTIAEIRPACYDVDQRVKDMDANGVLASMCFPSFPGMEGNFFANVADKDLGLACLKAYNDWHIDEWAGSHPGRFIPLPIVPLWDIDLAVEELRRVVGKGATAVSFSEDLKSFGYPSIHSGEWDPFFQVCVDEGVVLATHIASSKMGIPDGFDAPIDVAFTMPTWNALPCALNWIWSKTLVKFPDLRIALSEGGTSWIPGFLDRAERHYEKQKWTGADLGGLTPTELWQRHFLACFISDPSGLLLRDRVGINNIAYEVDYPHSDCTFPGSPEELWPLLLEAKCSEEEIRKITHENALRWLHFDPFVHIPKKQATVGALRARHPELHHIPIRSKAEYQADYEAVHGSIA